MKRLTLPMLLVLLAACAPSKDTVVIYSPHGPDVLGDYKQRFEAAHPGVTVQFIDMGSQQVYERVRGERNRPQADLWWGAPSAMFIQAAGEGLLEPYRPTWAGGVDAAFKDAEDRWYGTYLSPLAIVFNSRGHTRKTAPQTWDELLEPKWHKKITIREPLGSGTMRTFIGATMLREGSADAGIAWLKKLHDATEAYMGNPKLLFDHLKRNEDLVTVWLMADTLMQRERHGDPVDWVVPPQTPVITEGIAIVKGAPHPEWARKFYEFVTSPEALVHQAEAYGKVPARKDLDPATLPGWVTAQAIDAMEIDWPAFAANQKERVNRWQNEVYGESGG